MTRYRIFDTVASEAENKDRFLSPIKYKVDRQFRISIYFSDERLSFEAGVTTEFLRYNHAVDIQIISRDRGVVWVCEPMFAHTKQLVFELNHN